MIGVKRKKKANQVYTGTTAWACPLTTPMKLTLKFQGHCLKRPYFSNGSVD